MLQGAFWDVKDRYTQEHIQGLNKIAEEEKPRVMNSCHSTRLYIYVGIQKSVTNFPIARTML